MKKILLFAFIVLILLVGCTNKTATTDEIATTDNNLNSNGPEEGVNPSVKIDCNSLTNSEIMSAGIEKISQDKGSEKYITDYSCQHSWYVRETGKHTDDILRLQVTDYTSENSREFGDAKSSVDPVCKGKESLGISSSSCFLYEGDVLFRKGNYVIEVSARDPNVAIAIAKIIANKL